jgi:hypothetical protein
MDRAQFLHVSFNVGAIEFEARYLTGVARLGLCDVCRIDIETDDTPNACLVSLFKAIAPGTADQRR